MDINHLNPGENLVTEINITPFVDIVLVLLILFMCAAPVLYPSNIKLKLPAVTQSSQTKHITLRVTLLPQGEIYFEGHKISQNILFERIKKALSLDPKTDVLLAADKSTSHGTVLEVMDSMKTLGILEIAIAVEKKAIF